MPQEELLLNAGSSGNVSTFGPPGGFRGQIFAKRLRVNVSTFGPPGGFRVQIFTKRLRVNVSTFGPPRGFRAIFFSSTTSASYKGTVSEMSLRAILVTLMKNVYSTFS